MNEFAILLDKYLDETLTAEEFARFRLLLGKHENQEIFRRSLEGAMDGQKFADLTEAVDEQLLYQKILDKAMERRGPRLLKLWWVKYAAAILLVISGISIYYLLSPAKEQPSSTITLAQSDVAPGYNRAVLTLSNGQQVTLDSASSETIKDGTIDITNQNGQLQYTRDGAVVVNTMTTPKGGQYRITLADGSKVWLNAVSSITYPTAFTGKTREVSVTGEVYFEIAKNSRQPFIVKTPKESVTVLGTQFNVNVYPDEPAGKISLVEGSVKINDQILRPGQAYRDGEIILTDIDQDVAWKNGFFAFQHAPVQTVMRQIARWYDVEVAYEGKIPADEFSGKIGRNLTLVQVVRLLGKANIHCTIENKTITILSENNKH